MICPVMLPDEISVSRESNAENGWSALAELPMTMVCCAHNPAIGRSIPNRTRAALLEKNRNAFIMNEVLIKICLKLNVQIYK